MRACVRACVYEREREREREREGGEGGREGERELHGSLPKHPNAPRADAVEVTLMYVVDACMVSMLPPVITPAVITSDVVTLDFCILVSCTSDECLKPLAYLMTPLPLCCVMYYLVDSSVASHPYACLLSLHSYPLDLTSHSHSTSPASFHPLPLIPSSPSPHPPFLPSLQVPYVLSRCSLHLSSSGGTPGGGHVSPESVTSSLSVHWSR